ncbi:hypothetical protein B0H15DRAFT_846944 [Mycena belliarum]|uniref:BTB domain-containing protein n=1 Tax=Mycena belliarum TaxID=1033014 RepID=A0AAD6U013_9AGAR|nr:hypothetical protein B0H15DRAFT_846944 [Mycena belliae]
MSRPPSSMDVVEDVELEDDAPLAKRRRISDRDGCEAAHSSTCAILKKLWFSDGDIVLEIGKKLLKVHRKRLRCSEIFSDMLHLPQPSETDQIDGCPSVIMAGDALVDWEVTFDWIYHRSDFLSQAITFDILSGALRISTKYEIPDLRAWGRKQLTSRWPIDIVDMRLNALPHAAEAINLAQECAILEILPAAFYALSVQKFRCGADGGRSHMMLSPNDMRRFIAGREALQDVLMRILIDPLAEAGCTPDTGAGCTRCVLRRAAYWRTRLAPDARSPYGTWLVRELDAMLHDDAFAETLCTDCLHAHLRTVRWRLGRLRGAMPSFFLL